MGRAPSREEIDFLERIARYKEEYRAARTAAIEHERERMRMEGLAHIKGCWVPQADVSRVDIGIRRHERLALIETLGLLCAVLLSGLMLWMLFRMLLLP